tara:strand:+ start:335 stop:604 length:270 start_codon:yes stop_codon:yes gene_type:complete
MEANPLFGRPWDIAGRFNTFEEADKARKKLQNKENIQVKVKKQKDKYVVKTRSTVVVPKKQNKRNKGKRRDKGFYSLEGLSLEALNNDR